MILTFEIFLLNMLKNPFMWKLKYKSIIFPLRCMEIKQSKNKNKKALTEIIPEQDSGKYLDPREFRIGNGRSIITKKFTICTILPKTECLNL